MRQNSPKRFDCDETESIAPLGTIRRPSLRVARFADCIIAGAVVLCITILLYDFY